MALDPGVREVLANAICGAGFWFDIYSRLQEQVPEGEADRYPRFCLGLRVRPHLTDR